MITFIDEFNGLYALLDDEGKIVDVRPHPGWLDDEGKIISDAYLIGKKYIPIDAKTKVPSYNPNYQMLKPKPSSEWEIEYAETYKILVYDEETDELKEVEVQNCPVKVYVTYDVVTRSPEELKKDIIGLLRNNRSIAWNKVYYEPKSAWIDSEVKDILVLETLYENLEDGQTISLRTYYDTFIEVTKEELAEIIKLVKLNRVQVNQRLWQRENFLSNTDDVELLGWLRYEEPEHFYNLKEDLNEELIMNMFNEYKNNEGE